MNKQFFYITRNSFFQIIREPIYIILLGVSFLFIGISPHLALFTFGEEEKFVRECSLAVIFMAGLLLAVFSADVCLSRELKRGNLLFLFAKPVKKASFILAKFVALSLSLFIVVGVDMLALVLSLRMINEHSHIFVLLNISYYSSLVLAFFLGTLSNYWFRRNFSAEAVYYLIALSLIIFLIFCFISDEGTFRTFSPMLSVNLLFAFLLLYLAVVILGSFALLISVYLEAVPNLIICFAVFMLGLISEYLFGSVLNETFFTKSLKIIFPNWQYFWVAEVLEKQAVISLEYMVSVALYSFFYIGFIVCLSMGLFSGKEIS